jgi:type II secretory pathway component GspD/PulD (secretin)
VDWVWFAFALFLAAGTAGAEQLAAQAVRPPPMPPLPLTQLDDRTLSADLDNRTFTLTFAQPVAINDVLLLLVRGTNLSVVPDPSIGGSFIGELKGVTVRQALGLILQPLGLDFTVDGGVIHVFRREPETRLFTVDYIAAARAGDASVGVDLAARVGGSYARVTTTTNTDLFADIAKGIQTLLSSRGTFNVDRKAGLIQVADFPERLDRIGVYLDAVQDRVQRQVQIEARVLEIELTDEKATVLDWTMLRQTRDAQKVMAALTSQGKVIELASPHLVVLNNEPAIVKAEGLTIAVTPQIAPDGIVTLSLSPLLTTPLVAQSDMIARVADGETIVVAGFGRDRETRERKTTGVTGGWFGRSTVITRKHVELVVLLTPRIVPLP